MSSIKKSFFFLLALNLTFFVQCTALIENKKVDTAPQTSSSTTKKVIYVALAGGTVVAITVIVGPTGIL